MSALQQLHARDMTGVGVPGVAAAYRLLLQLRGGAPDARGPPLTVFGEIELKQVRSRLHFKPFFNCLQQDRSPWSARHNLSAREADWR